MSMFARERNEDGYLYEEAHPVRLVINITKGGLRGDVLTRLHQGTCIAYETVGKARGAQLEFLRLAAGVPKETGTSFASYGVVCIVDEPNGNVEYVEHIP